MVSILVPIAFFLSLIVVIVGVTRVISDGRTRRKLIETGATPELATALVTAPDGDSGPIDALKWGLVGAPVGIALIIVQFLPFDSDDPIVSGLVILSAAIGLLAFHAKARRPRVPSPARDMSQRASTVSG